MKNTTNNAKKAENNVKTAENAEKNAKLQQNVEILQEVLTKQQEMQKREEELQKALQMIKEKKRLVNHREKLVATKEDINNFVSELDEMDEFEAPNAKIILEIERKNSYGGRSKEEYNISILPLIKYYSDLFTQKLDSLIDEIDIKILN